MNMRFPDNVIWKPMKGSQEAFLASSPIFEVLFEGTRGGGKSIADETPVLTDRGWIRADEVTIDDKLVAGDGSLTNILGIYPQEPKQMFDVEFSDGQVISASGDHRWKVCSNKNTSRGWTVRTTEQMTSNEWSVPYMENPAQTGTNTDPNYPDPYLLGLIAGDGTIHRDRDYITIYSVDEEILQSTGWKIQRNDSWSTSRACADLETSRGIILYLDRRSKAAIDILDRGPEDRLAYLQGLMDTDGTVDKKEGKPSFCNTDEKLAKLAAELCWSLGGKATISLKKFSGDRDKYYYQVSISHQNKFNPFRLDRKAKLVVVQKKQLKRNIVRISKTEISERHRCFAVDHPSHTFIIDGYVVTHNTDCLLMSFCNHVGKGHGTAWKGILFRQTYKQLTDVISKTKKWIPQIWPDAKFNHSEHVWTFATGEQLLLRQFAKEDDYWNYHGHEYPWIGWEELCNWPNDKGYKKMFSCCRSSQKGMPRMIRATTNPSGPGHNWVKHRFKPHVLNMIVRKDLVEDGEKMPPRLSIKSHIDENIALLENDPDYKSRIAASADNEAQRKAWLEGSWDIVSGGMFDDVWSPRYNIVPHFEIPEKWRIFRSFDWGASKPFSVGWWAISNGEDVELPDGTWRSTLRGDAFRVKEWYGCKPEKPNTGLDMLATEIAEGIVRRELEWGWRNPGENWCRVKGGIADSQIFAAENGNCIAVDMKVKVRLDDGFKYPGIQWFPADKRPGSRATGWTQLRQRLKNAHPSIKRNSKGEVLAIFPREKPGLFIFSGCKAFIETVPVLPRDEKDPDDVNSDAEDHVADEARYFIRSLGSRGSSGGTVGHS